MRYDDMVTLGWLIFCLGSILLCLCWPDASKAQSYDYQWPAPVYSTSPEEIRHSQGAPNKTANFDDTQVLAYGYKFFGKNCLSMYYFTDNTLDKYYYLFVNFDKLKGPKAFFHEVHGVLKARYGEPSIQLVDYKKEKPTTFDTFREQVAHTERILFVQWQKPPHEISWIMVGAGGNIMAYVLYAPIESESKKNFHEPPNIYKKL